ncbi:MAG TPA: flagellar assembly protein FliW [Opitutaceae bacterium]|jgi:flagellar assembly factor FliW
MKLSPEPVATELDPFADVQISLPQGIIGFPEYHSAELVSSEEHAPFQWLKLKGPKATVTFVVVEPGGVIPNYELEIFDHDAYSLDLTESADALILNIVTLGRPSPLDATINLVGPILVNRRTLVGRQLVIANYSKYSARHRLVSQPAEASAALSSA